MEEIKKKITKKRFYYKPKKKSNKVKEIKENLSPLKIIPLGGLGEIGKNMTVFEYEDDIIIVDCGLAFPEEDMPGIDLVIPDFSYLNDKKKKIRGVFITHGHEDHIGALSYFLNDFNVPVYAARLSIGLIEEKLKESGILKDCTLNVINPGENVKVGNFSVEFILVNHSIPDACALAIDTPIGTVVHTGDFKIDFTPVDGQMINLARFGELGSKGVLVLLSDSTNAERPGLTPSETKVGQTFETLFNRAGDKRIIIATFSTNVHRIQQLITCAEKNGRKVAFSGRSMENVTAKAIELGYLKVKKGTILDLNTISRLPDECQVICTTGSQGEPMSALTRMAKGEHRQIQATSNDFIIISASPIPGNEKTVGKVINDLMHIGADVVYENSLGIHVSGHGCQEEIKTIIGLTKPKFFFPVHGEYKHLAKNREVALAMGIPSANIYSGEIGDIVEVTKNEIKNTGKVQSGAIMVDGTGIGDVGSVVLRDRRMLADEGLVVVALTIDSKSGDILAGPDIISRGFVYVKESEELINEFKEVCYNVVVSEKSKNERANIKQKMKDALSSYIMQKLKRKPLILSIIQEI